MEYSKFDWKYIAGFFDGEGNIGLYIIQEEYMGNIYYNTVSPRIQITQYHKQKFLIDFREWLKNEGIKGTLGRKNNVYICSWDSVKLFCEKILPYVIIKKEEVILMLKAIDLYFSTAKKGRKKYTKSLWNALIDLAIKIQDLKSSKGYKKKDYRKYLR